MEETEEGTLLSPVCRHKHFPNAGTSSHQVTAHQVQDTMRCRELAQGEPIPSRRVVLNIYSKSQCFHCYHRRSLILFSNVSMGDEHFQLCSHVQSPAAQARPASHFSMRDSSCSCRDVIWEEGVRCHSKAQLGLHFKPKHFRVSAALPPTLVAALPTHRRELCQGNVGLLSRTRLADSCLAATPGAELSTALTARQQKEPGSGNFLPWYWAETPQSCPGKSAQNP